jgi:hypothetical protein
LKLSLCFYFPYEEDSGVPVLFYRMANALATAYPSIEVSVIDFSNGVMSRNIKPLPNMKLISYEKGKKVMPPVGSILVMQTFVPYYWPTELELVPNQKLFFWNLHPQNLIPSLLPVPYLRELPMNNFAVYRFVTIFYPGLLNRLRKYTQTLIKNKGLFFMDKSNLDFTSKYLSTKITDRQFIPVPAEYTNFSKSLDSKNFIGDTIRFGWVGRLCDFKSYILVYAIKKLNEITFKFEGKKFEFHIVGNGPFEDYIKQKVENFQNIKIVFHGAISHKDLDSFIDSNIDIFMAMGTSALEGAKLGKPTFLLDPSLKEIKNDYIFRMLYDSTEYDLAHFVTKDDFLKNNTTLYDLLKEIIANYSFHSEKSSKYFFENHHLDKVKDMFLEKAKNTELTFSMIDPAAFKKSKLLTLYNKLRGLNA